MDLTTAASGTAIPVRFVSGGINQLGHDVNLVGPVDTDHADELGIFTDGIYSPFAALIASGFAAGDQVEVELVYEHSPGSAVPAPTKLTAVVRADGTLDTGFVWPSVFLPKWTRLSLKVTAYYAGGTPSMSVSWGVAFVTGVPATADALPAVADLATDSSTNDGNTGASWTDVPGGVINDGYHFFVYGPDNAIVFSNSMSDTSSADVATGLSDGVAYTVLVVGSAYVGGVLVYGVAATDSFTGAVAPNPPTDVVVTSDAASITVTSWVAPVGGTAVASYNVTLLDAAGTTVVQGPTSVDAAGPLTASFTGLTASTAYTVRITAVSAAGTESSPVDTSRRGTNRRAQRGTHTPTPGVSKHDPKERDTGTGGRAWRCSGPPIRAQDQRARRVPAVPEPRDHRHPGAAVRHQDRHHPKVDLGRARRAAQARDRGAEPLARA